MQFRDDNEKRKPLAMFTQSSLTDIVLLLLIFFLLTSSFVTNFGIRVNIPQADSNVQPEPQFINVTITPEGSFYVSGDLVASGSLAAKVREERQKNPGSSLVIRADRNAKVEDAVRVMNIGKALNMPILIATEPGSN